MRWRGLLIFAIWIVELLLLMYPSLCGNSTLCDPSPIPLLVSLGILGMALTLYDARRVRREARNKLFGACENEGEAPTTPKD